MMTNGRYPLEMKDKQLICGFLVCWAGSVVTCGCWVLGVRQCNQVYIAVIFLHPAFNRIYT